LGFAALLAYRSSGSAADDGRLNGFLWTRLWEAPSTFGWTMVGLAVCGFVFCWWARLHLGRLWSGTVTRKEGHRVVDTGPYALVRHPIYTGLLAAAIATAALKATPLAVAGTLLIAVGLVLKAQLEEKFLREELGAESYDAYRRRVPMLVPFT
jgi:protein-S-isoprenylcysteine O-methyltransferase Ste14